MDGGNGAFVPDSSFGNLSDASMDLDFMDELLYDGCWLETADEFDFLQAGTSTSDYLNDPKQYFPLFEPDSCNRNANPCQENYQVGTEKNLNENPPRGNPKIEELGVIGSQNQNIHPVTASSVQSGSYPVESSELGRRLWIAPTNNARPSTSVRERLMHAIGKLIKECTKDRDVLIQIWVPIKKEGKHVLATFGQPYLLDPKSQSLASYRNVQFPADEDSKELVDLPRRVFLRKLPEWTRDVSYFSRAEYPRKNNAKKFDKRGSFAVPVFERGSRTCLGVIEVVTTTQDVSYRPELESVCKALECMLAVDLRSPQDLLPPSLKACKEFCQAVVPEIPEILESVCKAHRLPLALTWAPCFRQGKGGCRHFDENYSNCICTVNSACIVAERDNFGFYMASSEQYLSFDQGIVGRAFATNKQCFSPDVAASSKTDYPLSHHAKMFELHAAIAIPVQSTYAGPADFVLELFLPKDCCNTEEQKRMWDILPITIQQACRSLHVVMDKELEETVNKRMVVASDEGLNNKDKTQKFASFLFKESTEAESSWSARVVEAQQKCEGVGVSWDHPKEENIEEFKVTSHWGKTRDELYHKQAFPEFGQFQQNSGSKNSIETATNASSAGHQSVGLIKSGDKRRTKTEKTISLQVLRQHFAGSLKDAAKSIGVCPTTLKRICRQHGITRWPSRKIKKVGHSLKKLQLVIDSVQGAEGAIQIGSFYTTFPEMTSPLFSANATGFPSSKTSDDSNKLNPRPENGIASASKSPSCSQSSGSGICCSTGVKQPTTTNNGWVSGDPLLVEDPVGVLKRTHSDAALHAFNHDESKLLVRSRSFQTFGDLPSPATLPPLPKSSSRIVRDRGGFRVKATFGAHKIRFTLQPNWGFRELQQEIARRFNIDDIYRMDLKYLDDDQEWVLLTCDADLEECKDVYKLSESHAIKMSLSQPHLGSSLISVGPRLVSSMGGATGTLFLRGHGIRD